MIILYLVGVAMALVHTLCNSIPLKKKCVDFVLRIFKKHNFRIVTFQIRCTHIVLFSFQNGIVNPQSCFVLLFVFRQISVHLFSTKKGRSRMKTMRKPKVWRLGFTFWFGKYRYVFSRCGYVLVMNFNFGTGKH